MERTLLFATEIEENAQKVLDWLQSNAVPEYFSKVEQGIADSNNSCINCYEGDKLFLQLERGTTSWSVVRIATEFEKSQLASQSNSPNLVCYGYKTQHGLVLQMCGGQVDETNNKSFCITKDSDGNVAVVSTSTFSCNSRSNGMFNAVTKNTTAGFVAISNSAGLLLSPTRCERTSLCPIVIHDEKGTVLPHVFATPFSQRPTEFAVLDVDGKKCISTGTWCLLDE